MTPHVLLVEDTRIAQRVVVEMLSAMGCKASIAENGVEAIAMAQQETFDLIFMDLGLPDLDVMTVVETIRDHYQRLGSEVPIIALTAHNDEALKKRCLKAGMQAFLTKPLTKEQAQQVFGYIATAKAS